MSHRVESQLSWCNPKVESRSQLNTQHLSLAALLPEWQHHISKLNQLTLNLPTMLQMDRAKQHLPLAQPSACEVPRLVFLEHH
jgi:hypothetical protein